jgi:rod shape-determining protein MreD
MRYILPIISLLIAVGLQVNLPSGFNIFGAKPDLALVVLIAYALAADPMFGATLGFAAGLIHGSAVGISLGSFIVTRTITGFLAGLLTTRVFSENPIVPMFSAAWLTLVNELLFLLINPRFAPAVAFRTIGGECLFNSLLALLLYWLLKYLETRRKIRLVNARMRI